MHLPSLVVKFGVVLLVPALLHASLAQAGPGVDLGSKKVIVVGTAPVTGDDTASAREAALRQAQKTAIEQVLGTYIESSFTAEQRETTKNDQASFDSSVQDRILTRSEGFIAGQKVLAEKRDGAIYKVTLEVVVRAQSLADEARKIELVLASAGFPKLRVVLPERYANQQGQERDVTPPAARSAIEGALLARRMTLAEANADVEVSGTASATFTGYNELNDKMYYVAAQVALRAVRTTTGKVLASPAGAGKGIGATEAQAIAAALKDAGGKAGKALVQELLTAWQAEAERAMTCVVRIKRLKSRDKDGAELVELVRALPSVAAVRELATTDKQLDLEVTHRGAREALSKDLVAKLRAVKRWRGAATSATDSAELIELHL